MGGARRAPGCGSGVRLPEAPPPSLCRGGSVRRCALPSTVVSAAQAARPQRHALCPDSRLAPSLIIMSTAASDGLFLSALQPNSSVTTYGLPSDVRLGNGSSMSDEVSKVRRVQEQVQMRLAQKSTLPRQNGSASHYATSGKHQKTRGGDPQPTPLVRFVSVVSRKKEKAQDERTRWSSGRGC